jgi:hypothetical protein
MLQKNHELDYLLVRLFQEYSSLQFLPNMVELNDIVVCFHAFCFKSSIFCLTVPNLMEMGVDVVRHDVVLMPQRDVCHNGRVS